MYRTSGPMGCSSQRRDGVSAERRHKLGKWVHATRGGERKDVWRSEEGRCDHRRRMVGWCKGRRAAHLTSIASKVGAPGPETYLPDTPELLTLLADLPACVVRVPSTVPSCTHSGPQQHPLAPDRRRRAEGRSVNRDGRPGAAPLPCHPPRRNTATAVAANA
jgi:hypothetical protein